MGFPKHFRYLERQFLLDHYYGFGMKCDIKPLLDLQYGGDRKEVVQFIDIGGVYTYKIYIDDTTYEELVHIYIKTSKNEDCVTIVIDKMNPGTISLHNMSYYNDCAMEGLRKPGGGSKLLRFALNLIIRYKREYGIKRIVLKDNSYLDCNTRENIGIITKKIKLAQLRILTHGNTWYGTYGFKPYDAFENRPSEILNNAIKINNTILETLETKKIDMINTINIIVAKEKLKNIDMNEIKRLIKAYPLMRKFIIRLTNEFKKYCGILYFILSTIYSPLSGTHLIDLYGQSFYLDI
jgi:hypothetical protein